MKTFEELSVKVFADGADLDGMVAMAREPYIKGFTTNPTLMRKAGISDYKAFASDILGVIKDRPISFEVFSDEFDDMHRQARIIASWGQNVYVKIPVTNTRGESAVKLVSELAREKIKLNVTAVMTIAQVREMGAALAKGAPSIVSLFAGRVADTGRDPIPMMKEALGALKPYPHVELLWASPRELLNIFIGHHLGRKLKSADFMEQVGTD